MLRRLVRPADRRAFPAERRVRMASLANRLAYLARRSENTVFCVLCVALILSMATAFILDPITIPPIFIAIDVEYRSHE